MDLAKRALAAIFFYVVTHFMPGPKNVAALQAGGQLG